MNLRGAHRRALLRAQRFPELSRGGVPTLGIRGERPEHDPLEPSGGLRADGTERTDFARGLASQDGGIASRPLNGGSPASIS